MERQAFFRCQWMHRRCSRNKNKYKKHYPICCCRIIPRVWNPQSRLDLGLRIGLHRLQMCSKILVDITGESTKDGKSVNPLRIIHMGMCQNPSLVFFPSRRLVSYCSTDHCQISVAKAQYPCTCVKVTDASCLTLHGCWLMLLVWFSKAGPEDGKPSHKTHMGNPCEQLAKPFSFLIWWLFFFARDGVLVITILVISHALSTPGTP